MICTFLAIFVILPMIHNDNIITIKFQNFRFYQGNTAKNDL